MVLLRFAPSGVPTKPAVAGSVPVLQVRLRLPRSQALHLLTETSSRDKIGEKRRLDQLEVLVEGALAEAQIPVVGTGTDCRNDGEIAVAGCRGPFSGLGNEVSTEAQVL